MNRKLQKKIYSLRTALLPHEKTVHDEVEEKRKEMVHHVKAELETNGYARFCQSVTF